jgi:hypothetical protein
VEEVIPHPIFGDMHAGPKTLEDGRIAYVTPLTFGRARINIGTVDWVEQGY